MDDGNMGAMAIKLDMAKAYDRVEWCFLEAMMLRLGFHRLWVQRIMDCLVTVSFSVLWKGNPLGYFVPSCGIRQGCPLSPYLFLFVAEGFSRLLQQAKATRQIYGVRISRSPPSISHLFHADDSFLFLEANQATPQVIKDILCIYEKVSGQQINFQKSALSFSPYVREEYQEFLSGFLGVPVVACHEKYDGIHWLRWDSLCRNKLKGGLGFRDFVDFNQALLAKQCWRLFSLPDLLVTKVYKGHYYPSSSLLSASVGRSTSLIWRSLLWGRELFASGLRWRVGDGWLIFIFRDAWIPIPYTFRIYSPPNLLFNSLVSELIIVDGYWNIELIHHSFWAREVEAILSIPLLIAPTPDRLCWHYIRNGLYTFKSGYQLAQNCRFRNEGGEGSSNSQEDPVWKYVWNLNAPAATKVFFWRAIHDILPCAFNLYRRHLLFSPVCSRGKMGYETMVLL
ncbi:uncharacterized protein LOC121052298 [Rosa chinensis]|uniref:uncharacterized protein LOC121052298 n=1 Tax=Rosa chinensis TaxID=74649 RepID=UPI001AD8EF48|nr:uncharacterized protein LOC121052298 [Rosa chinensis]